MPTKRPPLLGEVVPTFADRGCYMVSATDPSGRIFGFLDRSRYYFFQVAPQFYSRYSRGWVDPVPDPLPLRKSGSTGNRTRDLWICRQKLWPLDHRGGHQEINNYLQPLHYIEVLNTYSVYCYFVSNELDYKISWCRSFLDRNKRVSCLV
jgi:hypothetical protein